MTQPHHAPAPLLEQLLRSSQRDTVPGHTPGHKGGRGIPDPLRHAWGLGVFQADLPELVELDNLLDPQGIIAEAQALTAQLVQADRTWFLVNGSSLGLMAAIVATCGFDPGAKIILPRNVHRSVIAGLILSGATPIFVTPAYDPDWDLVLPLTATAPDPTVGSIAEAIHHHPDARAVLILSPTYEGLCADVPSIAQVCHRAGMPLLVDEAHGAHFGFHPALPRSALAGGADVVVQSAHKTLGALTQAAWLHLQHDRVQGDRLHHALQLLHTSSPSYLLLASLDGARQQMATQGESLWQTVVDLASQVRSSLAHHPHLRVLGSPGLPRGVSGPLDPTRLMVDVRGLGLTGFEADDWLNETQGVIGELPSLSHLTFILGLGLDQGQCDRLVNAITHLPLNPHPTPPPPLPPLPPNTYQVPALTPRQAQSYPQVAVPLEDAVGQISGELVCPYPPGIPLLLPGEIIRPECLSLLQRIKAQGGGITGLRDPQFQSIRTIVL